VYRPRVFSPRMRGWSRGSHIVDGHPKVFPAHAGMVRTYTMPQRSIRRRLQQVPRFSIIKGGEYLFLPGIRALNWLAELDN
jgi:hypothetical protein